MSSSENSPADKCSGFAKELLQIQKPTKENYLGHWSIEQNMKYITFLYKNRVKFSCKMKKKKIRLFQSMSNFIGTRSTIQCRTHHQKFEIKLGSTKAILESYKQQVGPDIFRMVVKNNSHKVIIENYITGIQSNLKANKKQQIALTLEIGTQTDWPAQDEQKNMNSELEGEGNQIPFLLFFPVIFY